MRQQLWARAVELSDGSKEGRIAATCVVARELAPPKGAKPIEWRLLTNRQVTSAAIVAALKTNHNSLSQIMASRCR